MQATELQHLFRALSDDELTDRSASGDLTEGAQAQANAELAARGLRLPPRQTTAPATETVPYQGDLTIVARHLSATEAHLLCACLQAGGVPAEAADTHLVQTYGLLSIAFGGASVRVPANFVEEAKLVIAAYERGDFALGDDYVPVDDVRPEGH